VTPHPNPPPLRRGGDRNALSDDSYRPFFFPFFFGFAYFAGFFSISHTPSIAPAGSLKIPKAPIAGMG